MVIEALSYWTPFQALSKWTLSYAYPQCPLISIIYQSPLTWIIPVNILIGIIKSHFTHFTSIICEHPYKYYLWTPLWASPLWTPSHSFSQQIFIYFATLNISVNTLFVRIIFFELHWSYNKVLLCIKLEDLTIKSILLITQCFVMMRWMLLLPLF